MTHINRYWPLDVFVALCFFVLAIFCFYRSAKKMQLVLAERRMTRDQLRQLLAMQQAAHLPSHRVDGGFLGLPPTTPNIGSHHHAPPALGPSSGALPNASFSENLVHPNPHGGHRHHHQRLPAASLPVPARDQNSVHAAALNQSFATQVVANAQRAAHHESTAVAIADNVSVSGVDTGGGGSAAKRSDALRMPSLWSDRRTRTVALLCWIGIYGLTRTAVLILGGFNQVPMDGSLECHFVTTFPAMEFMALQTALIARWARHVRDSEMRLYARDFPIAVVATYVSAGLGLCVVLGTIAALVDVSTSSMQKISPQHWNLILSGMAGAVYLLNGVIFVGLGLRLFHMWRTSRDPLRYEAAVDAHRERISSAATSNFLDGMSQRQQGGDDDGASDRHGCTRNGSRGQRILGVAFVFGLMLAIRGAGLLAFVLEHYNNINNVVHSDAAPAAILLVEFAGLLVTLRLLMPPGTSEGDRDPSAMMPSRSSGRYTATNFDNSSTASTRLLEDSPTAAAGHRGRDPLYSADHRAAVAAHAAAAGSAAGVSGSSRGIVSGGGKGGVGGGRSHHHHHGGAGASPLRPTTGNRTAWAGAHALEAYDEHHHGSNHPHGGNGEPNSSWKLAMDDESSPRHRADDESDPAPSNNNNNTRNSGDEQLSSHHRRP